MVIFFLLTRYSFLYIESLFGADDHKMLLRCDDRNLAWACWCQSRVRFLDPLSVWAWMSGGYLQRWSALRWIVACSSCRNSVS